MNPQIMALQKELAAEGVSMDQGNQYTQAMIDQNIAQIQREQLLHQQQQYQQQLASVNAQQAHLASLGGPGAAQQPPMGTPGGDFLSQKAHQELFTKSNLDYENRLRSHMYQFDDNESGNAKLSGQLNQM